MPIIAVIERLLHQMRRNPFTYLILIGLPGVMLFAFYFGFGGTSESIATTRELIIINNDEGLPDLSPQFNNTGIYPGIISKGYAGYLSSLMEATNYPQTDTRIFNVKYMTDEAAALSLLKDRMYGAILIFPVNFSNVTLGSYITAAALKQGFVANLTQIGLDPSATAPLKVIRDKSWVYGIVTEKIILTFWSVFQDMIFDVSAPGGNIDFGSESLQVGKQWTIFEIIVPGIVVLGILMQSGMMSALMSAELQPPARTIQRVRLSRIKPWEYLVGVTITQLAISPIQITTLLVVASFLGFQPAGSMIDGFIILELAVIFSIALTFIIGAIFSSPDAAGQSSGFISTPLGFMSGAFMTIPTVTLLKNAFPTIAGSRDLILWDVLPSTHAINAMRSILLYGRTLMDVLPDILAVVFLGLLYLVIGIIFYSKRRFSGDIA